MAFVDDDMGEGGGNTQLRLQGQLLEAVVAPDRHAQFGVARADDFLPDQLCVLGQYGLIDALLETSGAGEVLGAEGGVGCVAEGSDRLPAPAHHSRRRVPTHGLDAQQASNCLVTDLIGGVAASIVHPSPWLGQVLGQQLVGHRPEGHLPYPQTTEAATQGCQLCASEGQQQGA